MIIVYAKAGARMEHQEGAEALERIERERIVWIDLVSPEEQEVKAVEAFIGSELMTPTDAAEIESSSRFYDDQLEIQLNAHFLQPADKGLRPEAVTFALRNNVLITRRNGPLRSFTELDRRRKAYPNQTWTGYDTFISLFDLRIDFDQHLSFVIAALAERRDELMPAASTSTE